MKENMFKAGIGIILIIATLWGGRGPTYFEHTEYAIENQSGLYSSHEQNICKPYSMDSTDCITYAIDMIEIDFFKDFSCTLIKK
jgi:hypothetical protein